MEMVHRQAGLPFVSRMTGGPVLVACNKPPGVWRGPDLHGILHRDPARTRRVLALAPLWATSRVLPKRHVKA